MTPPVVDRKWFDRRIADLDIASHAELSRRIGVSKSMLSLVLDGKRNAHLELAKELSRALKVPLLEVARRLQGPMMDAVQAVAEIERGVVLEIAGKIDGELSVDFLPTSGRRNLVRLDMDAPAGATALRYDTKGSPAEMFDGALAVIGERMEVDPEAMAGRYNVVFLPDGRAVMRMVQKTRKAGVFKLVAAGVPDEESTVTHYAPVLAILAR